MSLVYRVRCTWTADGYFVITFLADTFVNSLPRNSRRRMCQFIGINSLSLSLSHTDISVEFWESWTLKMCFGGLCLLQDSITLSTIADKLSRYGWQPKHFLFTICCALSRQTSCLRYCNHLLKCLIWFESVCSRKWISSVSFQLCHSSKAAI